MIDEVKIKSINDTIEAFFNNDSALKIVPAKELMPAFIKAGIFIKDNKNGKPIRDILRELDQANKLQLIPYLHAERKGADTYWYFIPKDEPAPSSLYKQEPPSVKKEMAKQLRLQSDETYILDLCDTVLEENSERQKRFDFLLGDLHKDGITRTKLPVDAYYPTHRLVIEFHEPQPTNAVTTLDKPDEKTVSGVNRAKQRIIYDQRRASELPEHGIKLVEISFDMFKYDGQNKIIRNPETDILKVKEILKDINVEE
ncbi:MAG: hypothetical protein ABI315_02965 [Bacteroidia bacterium]